MHSFTLKKSCLYSSLPSVSRFKKLCLGGRTVPNHYSFSSVLDLGFKTHSNASCLGGWDRGHLTNANFDVHFLFPPLLNGGSTSYMPLSFQFIWLFLVYSEAEIQWAKIFSNLFSKQTVLETFFFTNFWCIYVSLSSCLFSILYCSSNPSS